MDTLSAGSRFDHDVYGIDWRVKGRNEGIMK